MCKNIQANDPGKHPMFFLNILFLAAKNFLLHATSILVNGCEPFSEDLWMEIKINKLTFNGVKLCSRCKVNDLITLASLPGFVNQKS